jgi:heptosyltransferase-3
VKILLTRLDHLGDLILTTPLIRALAKAAHSVDVMTPRWLAPVLEGNHHVNEAFVLEDVAERFPENWGRLADWIRTRNYDCILLPNPRPKQLLWASWKSGVPVRLAMQARIWGRLTGHRCLTVRRAFAQGRPFADLQLDLARALDVPTDGLAPDYFCTEQEILQAKDRIRFVFPDLDGRPVIGIHPGHSGNTCNLPSRVYGELAGMILDRTDWRIIVTGSAGEQSLLEPWSRTAVTSPRVWNAFGALDLRSLAAVISQMNRYVIVGTGPMHLASALGIRTLSPFCPLPPISFSIWGDVNGRGSCVQPNAVSCRRWRAGGPGRGRCDLHGEVTAENLWQKLQPK